MASINDIITIPEDYSPRFIDFFHFFRKNEYDVYLSNKSTFHNFDKFYELTEKLNQIVSNIAAVKTKYDALSASFIEKKTVDNTYTSKERFNNGTTMLITYSNMESLIKDYATSANVKEKEADSIKQAQKFADEMTDFVGAAMVGINQSLGGPSGGGEASATSGDTNGNTGGNSGNTGGKTGGGGTGGRVNRR